MAAWFFPTLSADEQAADRDEHPDPVVRRKMQVLWAVHLGQTRQQAADLAHLGVATAKRYLIAYRDGGLDGPTRSNWHLPTSKKQNKVVQGLAAELSIRLLVLPSYSPNLNLVERLWGFTKRRSVYGTHHANFASFRAAIENTLAGVPSTHAKALESLMNLRFQTFEDVSLLGK